MGITAHTLLGAIRAIGEETRLRIVALLQHGELTVSDLTDILGQSQPRISRHLKLLAEAGVVDKHREGTWAFFELAARRRDRRARDRCARHAPTRTTPCWPPISTGLADGPQPSCRRRPGVLRGDRRALGRGAARCMPRTRRSKRHLLDAIGDDRLSTRCSTSAPGTGRMLQIVARTPLPISARSGGRSGSTAAIRCWPSPAPTSSAPRFATSTSARATCTARRSNEARST